jgi:predicted NBD/HSP70 family sugar kinase
MPDTLRLTRAAGLDQLDDLVAVLNLLRSGAANTRPELGRQTGLGRSVVTQRVAELIDSGLVKEGRLAPSSRGRAPRELQFRADAGLLLVAELGATSINVGLADLSGRVIEHRKEAHEIAAGPERTLARVEELFDAFVADQPEGPSAIWGVGMGVPGPVEFATGRPVSPPIMPGWDGYDIRGRLGQRYHAPAWVDNEVNLMALGELRRGLGRSERDLIYIKVGTRVGAGLISGGRLHRGAQGCAGDVGYIAVSDGEGAIRQCDNPGCLQTPAGGAALARDAAAAADASPYLHELAAQGLELTARDVAEGAARGDATCRDLLLRSGTRIGQLLAQLVNFFNPSLIVIGGGVAEAGDDFLAAIRQSIYRRSLPLATRDLRIVRSSLSNLAGLAGAAAVVSDELFRPERIALWIGLRSPHGHPQLADQHEVNLANNVSA